MRSHSYGYGYAGAIPPLSAPRSRIAGGFWPGLTSPVLWLALLATVSMFGALQRPPVVPVNLTYLLFGCVVLSFLFTLVTQRRGFNFQWTRSDVWVVGLLSVELLSSLLATWLYDLPFGLLEGESITSMGVFIIYFLSRLAVRRRSHIYLVVGLLLGGLTVQSAIGTGTYFMVAGISSLASDDEDEDDVSTVEAKSFGDAVRLSGFTGNPNMFVPLPLMALPLAIGLLVTTASRWRRLLLGLSAGLAAMGILLAFSRSAWVGAVLAMVPLLRLAPLIPRQRRTQIIGWGVVAFMLVASVAAVKFGDALVTRSSSISQRQSLGARPEMWQHALEVLVTYPTGVGLGNYKEASERTFSDRLAGRSSHNTIVGITCEGGLLGGLMLLLFLWERVRIAAPPWRDARDKALLIGLSAAFLALTVHLCFHAAHGHIYIWVLAACQTNLRQLPPEPLSV